MFHPFTPNHSVRFLIITVALACLATSATFLTYSHSKRATNRPSKVAGEFQDRNGVVNHAALAKFSPSFTSCPTISVLPDASLPNGQVGIFYSQALTASGGTVPSTFAVTSGALPDGLTLDPLGLLSGTPTSAGGYSFIVQATDATGCTGSQDLAMVVSTGGFSPGGVDAAIGRFIRLLAPGDIVPAGTLISGHREWGFNMVNSPAMTFTNPTITINGVAGMTGILNPPGGPEGPIPFPIGVTNAILSPSGGLQEGLTSTNVTETVSPGFDSSRTMSPEIVPPGELQTLTVTVKLVDPRYTSLSLNLNVGGNCQSATPPANLDQGEQIVFQTCGPGGAGMMLNGPGAVLGKVYVFTFSLQAPLDSHPLVRFMPSMSVQSNLNRVSGIVQGTSVTFADSMLGGSAVFALDQAVQWNASIDDSYGVDYPGVFEVVSTPTPSPTPPQADLSITKTASPSGSVATSSQITYTMTVNNAGPSPASNVNVNDPIPGGTTFSSVTPSQGSCTPPPGGPNPPLNCSLGTINAGSSATITLAVDVTALPGVTISNTATVNSDTFDPNRSNNTSQTTSNQVQGCDLVVRNTNDSGAHSLRQAIMCANANPGLDTITFNIPGGGVRTIQPSNELPAITDRVIIDGYSQPGSSVNTLASGNSANILIEIKKPADPGLQFALRIDSGGGDSTIRGLAINGFVGAQIFVNSSSGNTISGNYIGTNALGTAGASNRGSGVRIFGGAGNIIGGARPEDGNLISGNGVETVIFNGNPSTVVNGSPGIFLDGGFNRSTNSCNTPATPVTGTIIQGNLIGTDHNGTLAIGNATGIYMACSATTGNIVGGTTAAERNVISGNRVNSFGLFGQGVLIALGASDNKVQGNYIGTNAAGTAAIANEAFGVSIGYSALSSGAPNNVVGGLAPETGNVISGNLEDGVLIFRNSNGNSVQNNLIGTDAGGTANLGNGWSGVEIGGGASGNKIGGPGAGNLIANNHEVGVLVTSGSGNLITQNSIYSNVLLGIDLYAGAFGVTPNDQCDADTGANNLQNFPVLTSALSSGGNTTIQGTLNSTANTTFTLEFFSNDAGDPSGFGEGQTFIGSTTVKTDGSCNASFTFTTLTSFSGQFISATATDPGGNTSEFSACGFVNADLSINKTASPNPVVTGSDLTYTLAVNYVGPAPAANVTVTDNVPAQTAFKSISTPAGWTCTTPAVGSNGTVTCTKPTMAPSESPATFTIVATVDCAVANGTSISDTATASSSTTDADPTNNSSTATVTASNPPPTISCPAGTSAFADASCKAAVPNVLGGVTASDNCTPAGSLTKTQSPAAGTLVGLGTTTITITVKDSANNTSTCTTTFTVTDNTPPTVTVPPNVVATTGAGATSCGVVITDATLGTATASDNCSSVTPIRSGVPAGNNFPVGTTTVTYTATDGAGHTTTPTQTVTVTDTTSPVITCPSSITVETCDAIGAVVRFPTPTATDNCGVASVTASPASGSTFPIGATTVTATAIDAAGNRSTCSFTVTVLASRGIKQNVLDGLRALRATVTNKDDREKLDLAILRLATSLNPQYWIDQTHVKPQYGDKVFDAEQDAVSRLRDLIKHNAAEEGEKHDGHGGGDDCDDHSDRDDGNDRRDRDHRASSIPEAIVRGFISRIVCADRLLAQVAINDAVSHGGNAKDIAKAKTKLANGDHDALKKKYEGAIEDYEEAWRVFNR